MGKLYLHFMFLLVTRFVFATSNDELYDGFNCDFERDFCAWQQGPYSTVDWERINGPTPTTFTGPNVDHTTGSSDGYYIYLETSLPAMQGDKAQLLSPTINGEDKQCLEFWYHMYGWFDFILVKTLIKNTNTEILRNSECLGEDVDTLSVYYWMSNENNEMVLSEPIWSKSKNQGSRWILAKINYEGGNSSIKNIVFEAIVGSYFEGDIAIDDITIKLGSCDPFNFETGILCNFEDGNICGYENDPSADFNWVRNSGPTSTFDTGPSVDVTLGTSDGHYMYIEGSSPQKPGDVARLVSVYEPPGEKCLYFWYHAFGLHIGRLNVYAETKSDDTPQKDLLWTINNDQGNNWFIARVPLHYSSEFRVIFEGIVGNSFYSDIAIDEIYLSYFNCDQPYNCDFDNPYYYPFCTWLNVEDRNKSDVDWIIFYDNLLLSEYPHLIPSDHTLSNSENRYAFITNSSGKPQTKAILFSESIPKSELCMNLSFNYKFAGTQNKLGVYIREYGANIQSQLWSIESTTPENTWTSIQIKLPSTERFKIFIEGTIINSGYLAIDDIEFEQYNCFTSSSTMSTTSVDGNTESTLTTIYTTTLLPSTTDSTSVITTTSEWTTSTDGSTQSTVYTTTLLSSTTDSTPAGITTTLEWTTSTVGSTQSTVYTTTLLSSTTDSTSIGITTTTEKITSTIDLTTAITDTSTTTSNIGTTDKLTSPISINGILDCDFETDICNYNHDLSGNFEWKRNKGTTPTFQTGPSSDHTTGDGYYIYIETSFPQQPNDKARIVSSIQYPNTICFTFWYHMFGRDIDTLNVYVDYYYDNNTSDYKRTLIWTKFGAQGNKWIQGSKTITSNTNFKIVFEGIVGTSYEGDIALDDILVSSGTCPPTKKCDFQVDFCDFENFQDEITTLNWELSSSVDGGIGYIDHTTLSSNGYFAYINISTGNANDSGKLKSISYEPEGNECLRFWYLLTGNEVGTLNIYQYMNGQLGEPIWSRSTHSDEILLWEYGQVNVGDVNYEYSIVFEGVKGIANIGVIAIDDVDIKMGPCKPKVNCNFEDASICSWSQYLYDEMDWVLNQGETGTLDTGPAVDVTTGTSEGFYIYVESSLPAKAGDKAILYSEYLEATKASCFSLWYFMYGVDVDNFNIYTNDTTNGLKLYSSINGNQGFVWKRLDVTISNNVGFRIILEGVVGNGFQGDIAVDEIEYREGECFNEATYSTNPITFTESSSVSSTYPTQSTVSSLYTTTASSSTSDVTTTQSSFASLITTTIYSSTSNIQTTEQPELTSTSTSTEPISWTTTEPIVTQQTQNQLTSTSIPQSSSVSSKTTAIFVSTSSNSQILSVSNEGSGSNSSSQVGAIIGGSIAGVVVLAIIISLTVYCYISKKKIKVANIPDEQNNNIADTSV